MHYLRRTLLLLSFLLPYLSHAQSDRVRCATDVVMQRFYENHPEHLHEVTNGPTRIYRPRISSRSNPIITIPVHVIITHPPGQAIGQGANLSLPRILSQINVMNDDFRRFNADAGNTPSVFDAVDAQIQFCLASVDPQGNPTDGITRFPTNLNLINNEVAIKTATGWDNQRYMNVWVGSLGNLLGYAYLPSPAGIPSANVDGIVVATGAFGGPGFATDAPYDEGRTATHEIGHYLGLRHVWGPGNGSCGGDDGFVDTPNQSGPNFGCPVHPSPSCGNGGDMFMNYMDYVNDDCMNAFSADQVAYMRLILETSRATLASSAATACNLQGAPLTAFIANQTDVSCAGDADGTIDVDVLGGTPDYTFVLNGVTQSDGLFTNLPAGNYTVTVFDEQGAFIDISTTINAPNLLVPFVDVQQDVSCEGAADGIITLGASGGTPGSGNTYTYSLNNGPPNTTGVFTDLEPGTYLAQVVDENGCTGQLEIVMSTSNPIEVTLLDLQAVSCAGNDDGSVSISASGGTPAYQYSLNGEDFFGSGTFENLASGDYTVIVLDANECVGFIDVQIEESNPLNLLIESQEPALCFGDSSGQVSLSIVGGTAPFSYAIDNETPQTSPVFSELPAADYTFTVIDANACITSIEATVESQDSIGLMLEMVQDVSCFGDTSGSFTALAFGGAPNYLYQLDTFELDTINTFSNLAAGTYMLAVEDSLGCSANFEIELATNDSLALAIDSIAGLSCFEGTDGYLEWSGAGGLGDYSLSINNDTTVVDTILNGLSAGIYTLSMSDSLGCTVYDTVAIAMPFPINITDLETTPISCAEAIDGQVVAAAQGGTGTLTYTLGDETNTTGLFEQLSAGSYTLTVEDQNGCSTLQDVAVAAPTALTAEMDMATNVSCAGANDGAITVLAQGGTGALSFSLNGTSNTTGSFTELAGGDYTILVSDENDCQTEVLVTIEEPIALSTDSEILTAIDCAGELGAIQFEATGGTAPYSFALNGSTNSTGLFDGVQGGTYTATITDDNGCTLTSTATLNSPTPITIEVIAQTNPLCAGEANGTLQLTANGGTGTLTYTLGETTNTSGTFNNLNPGEYTIVVADQNGCTSTVDVTLDALQPITVEMGMAANVSCAGASDGAITILAQGGTGALSFTLNGTSNTTGSFTELAGGDYTILVSDENTCQTEVLVTIEEPTALSTNSEILTAINCAGELGTI
ncbi:MAG: M43 family zinc metalloprotease, partial [Bacteroidota bacterium]